MIWPGIYRKHFRMKNYISKKLAMHFLCLPPPEQLKTNVQLVPIFFPAGGVNALAEVIHKSVCRDFFIKNLYHHDLNDLISHG